MEASRGGFGARIGPLVRLTLPDWLDRRVSRRLRGAILSIALHVGLLFVVLSGGRFDGMPAGDVPTSMLVLLEAPEADFSGGVEPRSLDAAVVPRARALPPPTDAVAPPLEESTPSDELQIVASKMVAISDVELPATSAMSDAERAALSRRLEQLTGDSIEALRKGVSWEQDGIRYSAVLIRESADVSTELEEFVAQVSASDRGSHLTTVVGLRRLAFSQFAQIVDSWDPMVQLHDDEVVGRFHSNSRLNFLYDAGARPRFFGKVTTAAGGFNTESRARRRDAEMFRGGKELGTPRINLPDSPQPFRWAAMDENARVHEFTKDTSIRFFSDGSYAWRARRSSEPEVRYGPSEHPIYFVAEHNVELFVRGVVAGRVLVYSPLRIVIEGDLTYARDPREVPDSGDFLGLVSNKYVEIAPPHVTGPGDLEINAAIFAGRRFVVTNTNHPRKAMLRIYGSLTAGSLTETEPRYGTRLEYDSRFEHRRPPGFPSTNRYEVVSWDGQWVEVVKPSEADSL